jgi:hypothetical protein
VERACPTHGAFTACIASDEHFYWLALGKRRCVNGLFFRSVTYCYFTIENFGPTWLFRTLEMMEYSKRNSDIILDLVLS